MPITIITIEINLILLQVVSMFAELVDSQCRSLPGAALERPFGPDTLVWTVGGRMFAIHTAEGSGVSVAVRSPQEAQRLVQAHKAISAPYLKGPGWALFPFHSTSPDELRKRIRESYDRVRNGLPTDVEFALPSRHDVARQ